MFWYNRRLGVWLWHFNRFILNTFPRIAEVYLSFLLFAGGFEVDEELAVFA
jgi:hypothetical protein